MRAFIYVGGSICPNFISEHPADGDLCIAADGGYKNAKALGHPVHIAVGDFDSFPRDRIADGIERIELPCEKDLTDSQVCIETAIARGASEIILIGGLSGRLDPTLLNPSATRTHP